MMFPISSIKICVFSKMSFPVSPVFINGIGGFMTRWFLPLLVTILYMGNTGQPTLRAKAAGPLAVSFSRLKNLTFTPPINLWSLNIIKMPFFFKNLTRASTLLFDSFSFIHFIPISVQKKKKSFSVFTSLCSRMIVAQLGNPARVRV